MTSPVVFFYVQHLWGVGHVYRATRIARGMAKAGLEVHLVWGGTRIEGFDFTGIDVHYLPAVRTADVSFSELLHADGQAFTDADKSDRAQRLLDLFKSLRPNIVLTEAFPFGRRQMRFELLPLLEAARDADWNPMIAASIRDIMQEGRKEKRVIESCELVAKFYDLVLVLVHGDEGLIRIEETLQGAQGFLDKVRYTGLVTPDPLDDNPNTDYACDVLVSVGGGAFGQNLTRTALEAMKFSKRFPENWLLTAGSELSELDFEHLQQHCPDGMRIVRQIPNLALAMKGAKVSVSHAGYNTVADILRAGCASVLYPYTDVKETEQLRRTQIMAGRGLATMLSPDALSAQNLARAIDDAGDMKPGSVDLDLEGATHTADILSHAYANRGAPVD